MRASRYFLWFIHVCSRLFIRITSYNRCYRRKNYDPTTLDGGSTQNLAGKSKMKDFREDIIPLLRPDLVWNYDLALEQVQTQIIQYLSGEAWKGA